MEQHELDETTALRPPIKLLVGRPDLVLAEIGVWKGINARNMLNELDIRLLYLIDPYTSFPNSRETAMVSQEVLDGIKTCCFETLRNYNRIKRLELPSNQAVEFIPDDSLDGVYIDGDHRYIAVRDDLENYYPKVKKGGLISGDDFRKREAGLCKAVEEFAAQCKLELIINNQYWWLLK